MKKKIFIGIAMSLFAVATVFNMNIAEQSNSGDVSLDAIEIMAQAEAESGGSSYRNCRRNGSGIPFFFRNCGACRTVFQSYSSNSGKCYR